MGSSDVQRAAHGLEALLLRQLLSTFPGLRGPPGSLQEALFTDTFADVLAKTGAFGVAESITEALAAGRRAGAGTRPDRRAGPGERAAELPDVLEGRPEVVSSPFGPRRDPFDGHPALHRGVDLPAPEGTGILAAEAGIVTFAGERKGYGQVVEVRHPGGLLTRYAHARRVLVQPGERVARGQRIAEVGSTGRSTGPHLHLEVLRGGRAVAPTLALKRYEARAEIEGREESTHPPRRRAP